MIDLQDVKLCSLLPPNLQDAKTRALGAAWDLQYRKLIQMALRASMVFAFVMELDVEMADHLCLSLDIKGYKADLPLQKKRLLIRSALLNYSRLCTRAALEDAVGIIHGGTTVQENWEYGGLPYHFRVAVDAGQEEVVENPMGRLLDTIMDYKNVRSWLDGLTVDVIEPGEVHTAAMSEIGMTLMIDPYRVKEMVQDGKAHYHAMAMQGAYLIIGEN